MRKVIQGWRYFKCEGCGTHWRETSRDCDTQSNSYCVNKECEGDHYGFGECPYKGEPDTSVEVDEYHNLTKAGMKTEILPND